MLKFSIEDYCKKYCIPINKKPYGDGINSNEIDTFVNDDFTIYDNNIVVIGNKAFKFESDIMFVVTHLLIVSNDNDIKFYGVVTTNMNIFGFVFKDGLIPVPVMSVSKLSDEKNIYLEDEFGNHYVIKKFFIEPITPEFVFLKNMFKNIFEV